MEALASDRVKAEMVIGAGTYSGSIKNNNGAEMIAKPKPIELCTKEPIQITRKAAAISIS